MDVLPSLGGGGTSYEVRERIRAFNDRGSNQQLAASPCGDRQDGDDCKGEDPRNGRAPWRIVLRLLDLQVQGGLGSGDPSAVVYHLDGDGKCALGNIHMGHLGEGDPSAVVGPVAEVEEVPLHGAVGIGGRSSIDDDRIPGPDIHINKCNRCRRKDVLWKDSDVGSGGGEGDCSVIVLDAYG